MRGFKRMRSLQKFANVHSVVYNHFNLRRPRRPGTLSRSTAPLHLPSGVSSERPDSLSSVENSDLRTSSDSAP